MNRTIFIINPTAGKGNGLKCISEITDYISQFLDKFELVQTNSPKHATLIASELGKEFGRVISVGGDGTLNEVINGLDLKIPREVGILPIGSGNDFANALNMNKSLVTNLSILTDESPKLESVDIGQVEFSNHHTNGKVNKTRFINSLGFGFDAYVAYLNQSNKKLSGIASYVLAVIKALKHFNASEIHYSCDRNSEKSGLKLLLAIGNSKTTGGGFYLTPDAEINDGRLNLCTIDQVSKFKLIKSLPKALFNKIKEISEVQLDKFQVMQLSVKNEGFFVHCDGENISKNISSARITLLQHQLKFISN